MGLEADVLDFGARCQDSRTAADTLADLLVQARKLGAEHLILSGVPVGTQRLAPLIELNGWPAGWLERYIENDYARSDAVTLMAAKTMRPFLWSDAPPDLADTKGNAQVVDEAGYFGIHSGLAVPMLSVRSWQSVLSFGTSLKSWSISERERAALVTLAMFAAGTVQAEMIAAETPPVISDREREVLLWMAAGKTAWETSVLLGISERTVKKHAANARDKFNVSTTTQAVVEAIRLRLIRP